MNTPRIATAARNETSVRAARSHWVEENGPAKCANPSMPSEHRTNGTKPQEQLNGRRSYTLNAQHHPNWLANRAVTERQKHGRYAI
ncbi:hypothetical protein JOE55_002430 [Kocuria palustris]|nr:hypothetical protein [Kocuria palustris]